MNNKGSKYYYSRLSDGEKNIYDKICSALLNFEPALSIHSGAGKSFAFDIEDILIDVIFDNPVFFYVNRERVMIKRTPMYLQLIFNYDYTQEEAESLWAQVEAKIEEFVLREISEGMSPLARQLKIHKFVTSIKPASKPYSKDCYSAVGALVRGQCVCEGYSKAYKLLCDRVGIASIIVMGDAVLPDGRREKHAWNITRINGVTAHTDATWDARYGVSNYDYFNICDADIAADHSFEHGKYPECPPNKINYFYKNGLVACDEQELREILLKCTDKDRYSVKLLFDFDFTKIHSMPHGARSVQVNKPQNIISFFGKL